MRRRPRRYGSRIERRSGLGGGARSPAAEQQDGPEHHPAAAFEELRGQGDGSSSTSPYGIESTRPSRSSPRFVRSDPTRSDSAGHPGDRRRPAAHRGRCRAGSRTMIAPSTVALRNPAWVASEPDPAERPAERALRRGSSGRSRGHVPQCGQHDGRRRDKREPSSHGGEPWMERDRDGRLRRATTMPGGSCWSRRRIERAEAHEHPTGRPAHRSGPRGRASAWSRVGANLARDWAIARSSAQVLADGARHEVEQRSEPRRRHAPGTGAGPRIAQLVAEQDHHLIAGSAVETLAGTRAGGPRRGARCARAVRDASATRTVTPPL